MGPGVVVPGNGIKASQNTRKTRNTHSAMATKRQKVTMPADVLNNADECARAIEAALEAMDPPIGDNIHAGILRLIAEFAEPHGE